MNDSEKAPFDLGTQQTLVRRPAIRRHSSAGLAVTIQSPNRVAPCRSGPSTLENRWPQTPSRNTAPTVRTQRGPTGDHRRRRKPSQHLRAHWFLVRADTAGLRVPHAGADSGLADRRALAGAGPPRHRRRNRTSTVVG